MRFVKTGSAMVGALAAAAAFAAPSQASELCVEGTDVCAPTPPAQICAGGVCPGDTYPVEVCVDVGLNRICTV